MDNPQTIYPNIIHDEEKGTIERNKDILPPVTIPMTANSDNIQGANEGLIIICCNTRMACIYWFSTMLILEVIASIAIWINAGFPLAFPFGIGFAIFLLFFSIVGLIGGIAVKKSLVSIGFVGCVIKAVFLLCGLFASGIILEHNLRESHHTNIDLRNLWLTAIIVGSIFVLLNVSGAVLATLFMKEINAGIFINTDNE